MTSASEPEWTEAMAQEFLGYLCRHLISLTGDFENVDASGNAVGKRRPYNFSGTVVSFEGTWYVLTAGHAVHKYLDALKRGIIRVYARTLAFGFGRDAITNDPIQFDISAQEKFFEWKEAEGLDYALFPLDVAQKECLKGNGIKAFPLLVPSRPPDADFYRYAVVGFPGEEVDLEIESAEVVTGVGMHPNCLSLHRLPNNDPPQRPWFKAYINNMGNLKSIVGVSGGPIFGFVQKGQNNDYYLIAIQSWWERGRLHTYGCHIDVIYADALGRLQGGTSS